MENLIFLFHFLRLTLLHYIYPNPRLSFHFFILFWLLCAFYYCKSLLPTIGRLDPRVPPGSVLLYPTAKRAPLEPSCWPERAPIARGSLEVPKDISRSLY